MSQALIEYTGDYLERVYAGVLEVIGNRLHGPIDGAVMLKADDPVGLLRGGGVGLVVREGTLSTGPVQITCAG